MGDEQKGAGRQIEWVTEHWYVYVDDPIALLFTDEDGTVRRVKFAKREYADSHFLPEEIEILKELRSVYPDEASDWWLHYEEIRQRLFELFPKNEKFLALLKPREETPGKQQPAQAQQPVQKARPAEKGTVKDTSPGGDGEFVDAEVLYRQRLEAGDEEAKYSLMEALDEKQIVDYLEGQLIQEFFYEFEVSGRQVVGISFAGTIQVAKVVSAEKKGMGGGIEILNDATFIDVDDGQKWGVFVRAVDKSINFTVMGYAEQDKLRWNKKRNKLEIDPFARRGAFSKAERNALRQLIPEKKILEMYKEWKKEKDAAAKEKSRPRPKSGG